MATIKALRLRLAQAVAPLGADVHDPDDSACPGERTVLEAAEAYDLFPEDSRILADVTDTARYAEDVGWVEKTTDYDGNELYQLTEAGAAALGRLRHGREA
jgi:hypothetical protein